MILSEIKDSFSNIKVVKQVASLQIVSKTEAVITSVNIAEINLGNGAVTINLTVKNKI